MQNIAASVPIPESANLRGTLRTNFEIDKNTGHSTTLIRLLKPGMRVGGAGATHADQRGELAAARLRDR